MVRYSYLDENKPFVLKFHTYYIEVSTTQYLYIYPYENTFDTKIGIWPTDGIVCLFASIHPFVRVLNVPIVEQNRLVVNITSEIKTNLTPNEEFIRLYPLVSSGFSGIEHEMINKMFWESDLS